MLRKLMLLLCSTGACYAQSQGPVYRLLYSPPVGNIGYLGNIISGKPCLFYILSSFTGGTTGASIFSVTAAGTFNPIYSFSQNTSMDRFAQATNGELYGSTLSAAGPPYASFYFSMEPSGKNAKQYPFPGTREPEQ